MEEKLRVVPGGFASGGHAPCGQSVVEPGNRRDGVAQESDAEGDFGGVDEAVERGIEGRVVVVLGGSVLRSKTVDGTRRDKRAGNGIRQG